MIDSGVRELVGGVGRESLLLGDVRLQPRKHGVEAVGELAKLVLTSLQLDAVGERPGRCHACGVRDTRERSEHATREQPPSQQAEDEQEGHHAGRERGEVAQEVGVAADHEDHTRVDASRQGEVSGDEQHGAREHQEARVAEREPEPNAQAWGSSHRPRRCIADAGHGGDEPGLAEPFAQSGDGDPHCVREGVCVLVPRSRQELLGADDAAFGFDEHLEHGELLPGSARRTRPSR